MDEPRARAARNNAAWCDTIARLHGGSGVFGPAIWTTRTAMPPFYPNAVTLAEEADSPGQLAALADLTRAGIPGEWGVKDSFRCLDLEPLGFRVLFDAEWLHRDPAPAPPDAAAGWHRLRDAVELAKWEEAWRRDNPTGAARIFPAEILADADVAVLAAHRGEVLVAGAIANRHAGAVGLTNLFAADVDAGDALGGAVAAAVASFPSLPVVFYEAGAPLGRRRALGFEPVGPLRIWVRRGGSD